ncbi:MAG: co-chaperone YbbN [Alphaproteobacteria bacterium]|nr:co-chaperone YbbN [Alphaproteobacteria bacterium]
MNTSFGGDDAAAGTSVPGDLVKDVDTASFMTEVIEASQSVPVIVDFWAPWCGPCKQLGPLLEKLVAAAAGKVRLVKVDIDQNQQLAQQLRIQSIPMVYAFFGGKPLDGFQGALPESELQAFIDRVVEAAGATGADTGANGGPPLAQLVAEGKAALAKGDDGAALQLFTQVLQADEKNGDALAGLARCYIAAGEIEAAKNLIAEVPEDLADQADLAAVRSTLELIAEGGDPSAVEELSAKVEANPNDLEARFDLAMALFAGGDREGTVDRLLEIIGRNAGWNDGVARKNLLKMFEAWGAEDPLTVEGRQRLSTLLFS